MRGSKMVHSTVSFGQIEVWCFPPTIGDNPSVSCGVPIALDSHPQGGSSVEELEQYELRRPPRRTTRDLKINSQDREEMCVPRGVDHGLAWLGLCFDF